MKKISVVIVTYNSELHIFKCLDALFLNNDIGEQLEVIVVDNCSSSFDKMNYDIQKIYGNKVIVIKNSLNGGYGQGNNVGIKAANSSIIMIMNPDIRLTMPLFKPVLSEFEINSKLVMYGIKQLNSEGKPGKSFGWITRSSPYIAEPFRFLCQKFDVYWQKYMFFNGSCFFIRKKPFEKVGLFDEKIFMYNEEEDIHDRLLNLKGCKFKYNNSLNCIHCHPSVSDYSLEEYKWMERNLASLLYKDGRDGIARDKTIKRAIQRTNISIWSSFKDKRSKEYYMRWKETLKRMLK